MVYILLKRKPLPRRASTPDVKQTLKPDLLEGANPFGLGFLPPRVWRQLDEARRVTPGERQKKTIEKSICVLYVCYCHFAWIPLRRFCKFRRYELPALFLLQPLQS